MTDRTIAELTAEIKAINIEKGWRSAEGGPCPGQTWGDYVALLHSEVSEALEAYRSWRLADATGSDPDRYGAAGPPKPEGVGSELADVLIRLLDMADVFGYSISGYDHLSDLRSHAPDGRFTIKTFGDFMSWLHWEISCVLVSAARLAIVLRTLVTVARAHDIDLQAEVERKIAYNRTRSFQHGGRTLTDVPITAEQTQRFNGLYFAMPTDHCGGWWTEDEVDGFISAWEMLDLPALTTQDASGEQLVLWTKDLNRAASMLGLTVEGQGDGQRVELARDEYRVCIGQAREGRRDAQGN